MNTVSRLYYRSWRTVALALSLSLVTYVLYFHRLGNLLPGYSPAEVASSSFSAKLSSIGHDPVSAPYSLLVWLFGHLNHQSLLTGRIVAAAYGVLAAGLFFVVIRRWHGFRAAWLATMMFATSAGLLHVARQGTPQVLQMSILVFIGAVLWYRRQKQSHRLLATYICTLVFAVLWYVPGMVWFELFGLLLLRRGVLEQLRSAKRLHVAAWSAIFLVLIAPLVVAAARDSHIVLTILGLPSSFASLRHFGSNLLNTIFSIGVRSNGDAALWVGHLPLLNITELVLAIWGIYRYARLELSTRSVFLAISGVIAILLVSLGGPISFTMLVPLLYICIAAGLDGFLGQWLRVFPRNPIARATGTLLICVVVGFSILYQVRSYFVAWPHSPAARTLYNQVQPR